MLSENSFRLRFERGVALLKEFGLFKSLGVKPLGSISSAFLGVANDENYKVVHKTAIENFDYDILLFDDSFFQFSFQKMNDELRIRSAFYQNPQIFVSYEEFLHEYGLSEEIGSTQIFLEEYSQYLTEMGLNSGAVMIRYDLDKRGYTPLVHSTSHFHIGHNNEIRIPCKRIVSPAAFVLFVIKHVYISYWRLKCDILNPSFGIIIQELKGVCEELPLDLFQEVEQRELYLN